MENRMTELYRSLVKHFSELCGLPVTVVDSLDRDIILTYSANSVFFCDECPNRCRLLQTMLYGCNEAQRWNGRYVFYCPIGLVFSAITVPESNQTVLAGPLVAGDVQDTIYDLPDYISPDSIKNLLNCSANALNHVSSILEMAVYGIRYRPEPSSYDRNIFPGEAVDGAESKEFCTAFPFAGELEDEFKDAVKKADKPRTRALLNQLLKYVYSPHPDQFALIKSRAIYLVMLLAEVSSCGELDQNEAELYRSGYIPKLKAADALEELDVIMSDILHHFIDYTFDFSQIRHSDTIYRAMEYIKSNYSQKIGLEDIAAYVHLSCSHLSSIFRKETGLTISVYINQVRIEKSKPMLLHGDIPIVQIADQCGFGDQSYFTRVFKKQTGVSPKKFRLQALGYEGAQ